jgi:hypothetical protein
MSNGGAPTAHARFIRWSFCNICNICKGIINKRTYCVAEVADLPFLRQATVSSRTRLEIWTATPADVAKR